jgi:phage replication initiation protein
VTVGSTATQARPVSDGKRVRWTLERAYRESQARVRLDWLRFTVPVGGVFTLEDMRTFRPDVCASTDQQGRDVIRGARAVALDVDHMGAMGMCKALAVRVAAMLGDGFEPGIVEDRGMDYYTVRCPILHRGERIGYALAGGKQQAQRSTLHVSLEGQGMLHVSHAKYPAIKRFIDEACGHITRVDLACDVFEGDNVEDVSAAWLAGDFDVRGKRPKQRHDGGWDSGSERTYYVGSRATGKLFRAYEKGDQLFGAEANDPWVRYEVEFRRENRVIETDVLIKPADFFAGSYEFCRKVLDRLGEAHEPQRTKTGADVAQATEQARVQATLKWVRQIAGPAIAAVWNHGGDLIAEIVEKKTAQLPRKLVGICSTKLGLLFEQAAGALAPVPAPSLTGA